MDVNIDVTPDIYHKQLNGSAQRNLTKALNKFVNLDIPQKELILTRIRELVKDLEA